MRYRAFRHDGQFLDALHTTSGEFSVPAEQHAAGYAAKIGVESVEVVEGASDPRGGSLIEIPADPQFPEPNPQGFMAAMRDEYGEDFWFDLADAMPSLHVAITALQSGDARTARRGITRMVVRGFLTEQQAQDIEAAMEAYGLSDG